MIEINDYNYNMICHFGGDYIKDIAKHSIGAIGSSAETHINICHNCLLEIVKQGLPRLSEEERAEILAEYMPEQPEPKNESKEPLNTGEPSGKIPQEQIDGDNPTLISEVKEEDKTPQKLDNGSESREHLLEYREELLSKARELNIPGKIESFTNKMLEIEINKEIVKRLSNSKK